MNKLASHVNRIQLGALISFNQALQELDVETRIDVMLELLVLDARISEHTVQRRGSQKLPAQRNPQEKHAPHVIVPDRGHILLAPSFFPEGRFNPIALGA